MNLEQSAKYAINQLIGLAQKLYNRVPVRLRWIAAPLVYFYRFCQLLSYLRLKLWILTGDEKSSQLPLSILYAAKDSSTYQIISMNIMLGLLFGESYQKVYLGRAWIWNIQKVIAEKGQNCSFMIVQMHGSLRKHLRSSKWFYIPTWLRGEVDIPIVPEVKKKHTLRSDLRKFQNNSLRFEVTRDLKYFDDFYHNMYVPKITKVYGNKAYIVPYEDMRTTFQNCDLLLIKKQEERIAGLLIMYEKTGPRLWVLGIRDANREFVKDGAITALYHYSFIYLEEKGFTKVNLGVSKAFFRDGVLQYKRKWSQKIIGTTNNLYALKILSFTNGAKAFLQQNPFIFKNGGILNGAIFSDAKKPPSAKELKRIEKLNFSPGLSKLFIYHFQHGNPIKQDNVTPELFERIVSCSVEDII